MKGAIPPERAKQYQQRAFEWIKSFHDDFDSNDPTTWDKSKLPVINERLSAYEHYGVIHEKFMWEARMEPGVLAAFARIWGTDELLVSFDALNITLPNLKPVRDPWPHVDQAPRKRGLHCLQGIINLSHAGPDDGSLVVVPGSNRLFEEFFETKTDPSTWEFKDNRYFGLEDMAWFEERGLKPVKVLAEPGDLIIWDSRTIHWGGEPDPERGNVVRTVVYAAYSPAKLATPDALKEKKRVFDLYGATTHWPHDNIKLRTSQPLLPDGTIDARQRSEPMNKAIQTDQLLRLAGALAY